uniref:Uncharacterized protein n=1 Tax=Oryza glumipatula TaxID=40148 RepID=A0A0D9Y2Y2_9ORYZ
MPSECAAETGQVNSTGVAAMRSCPGKGTAVNAYTFHERKPEPEEITAKRFFAGADGAMRMDGQGLDAMAPS